MKKNLKISLILLILAIVSGLFIYLTFISKVRLISVKYKEGQVDISKFESLNTSRSTFVQGGWYRSSDNYMIIKINNTYYQYCNVPDKIWNNFHSTESFGDYYNSRIKGAYICEQNKAKALDINDFVFDHIVPLALGGSDFSTTESEDEIIKQLKGFPTYNESYPDCYYEVMKIEPKMLKEANYARQSDGSWIDKNGDYPSLDFDRNIEMSVTESFKNCVNN